MLSWDEFNAQETPAAKPQPKPATPPQSETVSDQAASARQAPAPGSAADAGDSGSDELRGRTDNAVTDAVERAQAAVAEMDVAEGVAELVGHVVDDHPDFLPAPVGRLLRVSAEVFGQEPSEVEPTVADISPIGIFSARPGVIERI